MEGARQAIPVERNYKNCFWRTDVRRDGWYISACRITVRLLYSSCSNEKALSLQIQTPSLRANIVHAAYMSSGRILPMYLELATNVRK